MSQQECRVRLAGLFVKNQYLLSDSQLKKSFIYDPAAFCALFNKLILKRTLKRADSNTIFHPANSYRHLIPEITEVKNMVFTIHDMIVEKQNKDFNTEKQFYVRQASKIIAVSETTKKDVVDIWGIAPDKIKVIYHGSSLNPQLSQKTVKPLPDHFLLFVGERGGYKNFATLVRAFASLSKKHNRLYLVCAGKCAFSQKEIHGMRELGVDKKVLCFVRPNDNELAYLYAKAEVFVFPSFNEGFGIPVLEAWVCKTPVILSDNPCFNEVAAEAGCYFDPRSEESIRETIEKTLLDKNLQSDLVRKGTERLTLFSWEKSATQTYQLYKSLL
jgi:glycosyltransferase involved in cell wall biosynthesis